MVMASPGARRPVVPVRAVAAMIDLLVNFSIIAFAAIVLLGVYAFFTKDNDIGPGVE